MERRVFMSGLATAGLASSLNLRPAFAEAAYPDHTITMMVGFPPGGGSDVIARLIGAPLSVALGQPVVIENRPGAGGNIAIGAAAHAPADGYTMLFSSSVILINPSLYKKVPFDPVRDFKPLVNVGVSPVIYIVKADCPFTTLADLVGFAKAHPGKLNYTDPGIGTTGYLSGRMFKQLADIDIMLVPYPGGAQAPTALLAGTVDFMVASVPSVSGLLSSGKLRMIAQGGTRRMIEFPDVPTLTEAGYANADAATFQGTFMPAGTPQPIMDRLARELTAVIQRPEITRKIAGVGLEVLPEGPDAFQARVNRELPYYRALIAAAGISLEL